MIARILRNFTAVLLLAVGLIPSAMGQVDYQVVGKQYGLVQLDFAGQSESETNDSPNPFLDYRLLVNLHRPAGGGTLQVLGFFNGNGRGIGAGSVWSIRFIPDVYGLWSYDAEILFGLASDVGIVPPNDPIPPGVMSVNSYSGVFGIEQAVQSDAPSFYTRGTLRYVGEHYYRFDNGEHFLKGGADSPENLFGYVGFDDIQDIGGAATPGLDYSALPMPTVGFHRYPNHVSKFNMGIDPLWNANTGFDSQGIIGALNYLSENNVNSVYFLPMNEGGDGQETTPHIVYGGNQNRRQYDISRLDQWHRTLDHAQRKGVFVTLVLAEAEPDNKNFYGNSSFIPERKLFYKELSARFGYMPAMRWLIMEENSYSIAFVKDIAEYIQKIDPYDHPIGIHTPRLIGETPPHPFQHNDPGFQFAALLGDPGISLALLHLEWVTAGAVRG